MNSLQLFYMNISELILLIVIKTHYTSNFFNGISKSKPIYFIFYIVYSIAIKYNKKNYLVYLVLNIHTIGRYL
jgi:hypothetical protein